MKAQGDIIWHTRGRRVISGRTKQLGRTRDGGGNGQRQSWLSPDGSGRWLNVASSPGSVGKGGKEFLQSFANLEFSCREESLEG